jgi:signal transduction histidine kinase
MATAAQPVPLNRRLVTKYLMFGLACLLLCLATSLALAYRNSLIPLAGIAVTGPIVILLIGAAVLYQSTRLNSLIEQQLHHVSQVTSLNHAEIRCLTGSDPVSQGWNAILDRISHQQVWTNLEERLSEAVKDLKQEWVVRTFQQLPTPIAVTEDSFQIAFANQAFEALAQGLGTTQVVGHSLLDVLQCQSAANADEITDKLTRQNGNGSFEVHRGPTIHDGVLQISRHPLVDKATDARQEIWTVRDITQQLLADALRNQFVLTATHELRTPLGNIKAYAETLALEEGIDVDQQKEFCNIINAEATRLSRFVDELLNISQMESGSLNLKRHETDLMRLLEEVMDHVAPEMKSKEITLDAHLPPKLTRMCLDKDKFTSALVNLLGNATKYTPTGGRVSFTVEQTLENLAIYVEDSGVGISQEEMPHIFEKFFRSADNRVREVSGNGLGLAFTQEVVRLHGGKIDVHSELDKGTRFTVTLPC